MGISSITGCVVININTKAFFYSPERIVCPLQSRHGPSACSEPLLLVMLLVHQSAAEKGEVLTYKVLHVKQSV